MPSHDTVRIATLADIHYAATSQGMLQPLFTQMSEVADILVIAGDLTDYGLADEARLLARDLTTCVSIPVVAVLGNHDFESGEQDEVRRIMVDAGVHILDGDSVEILGIGFAGVKGFAGGFGRGALGPWGEPIIKLFVQEALNEALKLETALARLKSKHRIAVLHYAPIRETVEGEPIEILPWLGCSRLEEPLGRFEVSAVVHGHAHKGAPEGRTATGIPVYNVAMQVLKASFPDRPPFRLIEVPRERSLPEESARPHGRRASDREPLAARIGDIPVLGAGH
ncbi:MAG TPA: metallophosphoesterase [Gemmatimonadaceae bacterium]|nr:metallophosphoesterase [Gemmatimonadaceae bacterium]